MRARITRILCTSSPIQSQFSQPVLTCRQLRCQRQFSTSTAKRFPSLEANHESYDNIPEFSKDERHEAEDPKASATEDVQEPELHGREYLRVVPESPSYYTGRPSFTDYYIKTAGLVRACQGLPKAPPGDQSAVRWKSHVQFRTMLGEPVAQSKYSRVKALMKRLNKVERAMLPKEARELLISFLRNASHARGTAKPKFVDEYGRSVGVGRRKSASAQVWVVEGDGEILVNNKEINQAFPRVQDRESALWPLKITSRMDRYNVWALVTGGGTTGQAEAVTLGLARALVVQEPGLKTLLRKAGTMSRNPKRVERKKPGRLKARKMPTWVKR